MPGQASLDPNVILTSLGIPDADPVQPLTGGSDTALWQVVWRGGSYALRVFRSEQAGNPLYDMALFYAWAGAVMIRDLSPRIGKPEFWLQDHHLDPVRA
jgi:hypothetical protein